MFEPSSVFYLYCYFFLSFNTINAQLCPRTCLISVLIFVYKTTLVIGLRFFRADFLNLEYYYCDLDVIVLFT